jgi:hypothetical protein
VAAFAKIMWNLKTTCESKNNGVDEFKGKK